MLNNLPVEASDSYNSNANEQYPPVSYYSGIDPGLVHRFAWDDSRWLMFHTCIMVACTAQRVQDHI